jgi:hypothetical protein
LTVKNRTFALRVKIEFSVRPKNLAVVVKPPDEKAVAMLKIWRLGPRCGLRFFEQPTMELDIRIPSHDRSLDT